MNSFLKKYIELDTSREDGKYYPQAISLLSQQLSNIGFTCEQVKIPHDVTDKPNRIHLIARKHVDNKLPTLLIYNHIDVVPANYPQAFTFTSDEKKIYGRGACDHKGSTAVVLTALEKLKTDKLRFNIIFLATTDEETDQRTQLEFIARKLKLPKKTLIFDPDTFAGGVSIGNLGCLQLDLTIHGKASHSAASHLGINTLEQAGELLTFFKEEKLKQENTVSKETPFPSSQAKQIVSRCNVNMIQAGTAPNVIPDVCHLTIDYRFIPEVTVAKEKVKIFKRLEKFCHDHKIATKVETKAEYEGYVSHHEEIDKLDHIYKKYSKLSGQYCVMGSTPAAHWAKELGVAHFGIGIARGDTNMHSPHEFAYIEDMISLEKTLVEFLI